MLSRGFLFIIKNIMILFAHVAFADAVSSAGNFSWPMAFLFGLISHHFLDLIPHLDAGCVWPVKDRDGGKMPKATVIFIAVEALLTLGFLIWCAFFLKINWAILFWASFGAALPDLIVTGFPFFIPKMRTWPWVKKYGKFHYSFFDHLSIPTNWIFGIFSTILIIGVSFWLLLK